MNSGQSCLSLSLCRSGWAWLGKTLLQASADRLQKACCPSCKRPRTLAQIHADNLTEVKGVVLTTLAKTACGVWTTGQPRTPGGQASCARYHCQASTLPTR